MFDILFGCFVLSNMLQLQQSGTTAQIVVVGDGEPQGFVVVARGGGGPCGNGGGRLNSDRCTTLLYL